MSDQTTLASLPEPSFYLALGHLCREFDDIQKQRIMSNNRLKQLERDGFPEELMARHQVVVTNLKQIEKGLKKEIESRFKGHFMEDWIADVRGMAVHSLGLLLSVTWQLDPWVDAEGKERGFKTPAKLWKYLGMHVVDGRAPRRERGVKLNYSPKGRTYCHIIAENLMKLNDGKYRDYYDTMRAGYLLRPRLGPSECPFDKYEDNPHKSKEGKFLACIKTDKDGEHSAHVNNAALRYMMKKFLADLLVEWNRRVNAIKATS